MSRTHSFSPLASTILAGIVTFTPSTPLWALHGKNAGPETVEIKFKLPPPKPLSPEEELATFKIAPGFRIELVAAEPMVDSPIAITWDEKGRMFVCEMRGYMHDVEGTGEDQPVGRIVMLEDTDGDGKMDKRTVFADGLVLPRAIMCVNGGLLVAEPPNLWFMKDTDGDGVADTKEVVDGSYGTAGGQPEHMANSPTWMLDNWIYSANHAKRYRFKDGKFIEEVAGLRGQWGLSQDDFGRIYFNSNSDFLRTNAVPEVLAKRNPNFTPSASLGVQVVKDQTTWPSHPTPGVNRGYGPKTLREDGSLSSCTATCGASIYRGNLFSKEYRGNAFVPEPAGNLVKRFILSENAGIVTGVNAKEGVEFWTSTDERFRPVNSFNGPDGALYVVDQYRGIIQHKSFLTHYLIANIKDRNLETPFDLGRIWRVVPDKAKSTPVQIPQESDKLVEMLGHANGWARDTAQRLLVERKDAAVTPALVEMAQKGKSTLAKIHALWTLEGVGGITPEVLSAALKDEDAKVRATAVRLSTRAQIPELAGMVKDNSLEVHIALGFQLSAFPEGQDAMLGLAVKAGDQPLVRDALLSGLRGRELEILQALIESKGAAAPKAIVEGLAQAVMNERRKERVTSLLGLIAAQTANSPLQLALLSGASGKLPPPAKVEPPKPAAPPASTSTPSPVTTPAPAASTTPAKPAAAAGTAPAAAAKPPTGPVPKLLYLDSMPPELEQLSATANPAAKVFLKALDARLAWPNKPGVPPPPVIKPLTAAETALFETGKGVYTSLCAGCHQPTGTGMEGLAPALVDSEWVLATPEVPTRILLHGLAGPIKVGNQSWNLEMPPLGAALTDEQIAGVLTFIRRSWEHNGSPVTPAAVAKTRQEMVSRTKSWTSEELKAVMSPKKAPATTGK